MQLDRQPEDEQRRAQQRERRVGHGQHAAHDDGHRDDAHDAVHGREHQQHAGDAQRADDHHAVLQIAHRVLVRGAAVRVPERGQHARRPVVLDPGLERVLQEEGGVAGHEQPRDQQKVHEEEEQQQAALVAPGAHEAQRRQQHHAAPQRRERRGAGAEVGGQHQVQRQRQQRHAAAQAQQRQQPQHLARRTHGMATVEQLR
ncbi:unnamed protein product [Phytophthora lilii]|uniref:Unnamed protein product n=1 Tax=Phytophthora lilii TaxID=2077276 RepID=A0A9W6TH84_9STRA|nr:unnamed protein product [Phytophthora lilii]